MIRFRLQVSSQFSAMVHNELEEARAGMDLLAGEGSCNACGVGD